MNAVLSTRSVGKNNAERRCRRWLVADDRSPSRPSWELSPRSSRGRSGRRQPYYDAVVAVPEAVAVDDTSPCRPQAETTSALTPGSIASRCDVASAAANAAVAMLLRMCCVVLFSFLFSCSATFGNSVYFV